MLGHFGTIEPEKAAEQVITKLQQTSASKTELSRHLADPMLVAASNSYGYWPTYATYHPLSSKLWTLSPHTSKNHVHQRTTYIKEEITFSRKVSKKGEQEGKLEGKQEMILKFLKDGILTTKQLASYFDVTEDFVEQLRKQR